MRCRKMYKYNGEYWYKAPPLLKRIRKWFIWIGGWERPNSTGWRFRIKTVAPKTKEQIEYCQGKTFGEIKEYLKDKPHKTPTICWNTPTPICLFGHRITIQGFGVYISTKQGYIVWDWKHKYCYKSVNGTPSKAHVWYFGAPPDIIKL